MRNQGAALKSPKGWGIWLVAVMVLAVIFLPAGAVGAQTELGSISGTVYDNASPPNPLEGAFVYTYPAGGGPWMGTAVTGADGRYVIPTLPSGDYEVHASLDGWADLSPSPPVTVTAPYETTGVDRYLVPTPASINGRVVSSSGDPVGGVSVNADNGSDFVRNTITDPNGYFNIEYLPYGTYRVGCPAQDMEPLGVWVYQEISGLVLSEAEPVAGGLLITLQPGGFISGTVTGPDGQPLIGIMPHIEPWEPGHFFFVRGTDANGQYVLGPLPIGNYRVSAMSNPGYADEYYLDSHNWIGSTIVPVTAGSETSDIDFTLEPGGAISGRIVDLDGNPVYGVSVLLENPDIIRRGFVTRASEAYSFSGLPYGAYTMTCPSGFWLPADLDWQQQVVTVVLGPDTPDVVYDFLLAPPAVVVSGTVKFTPTVLNLNSSADLRARIELEPGYSAADIDLTTIRLESDLGVVAAERAEERGGLLWAWFDHDTLAPILSVSDDLTLTVKGSIGSADLEAVGHLRVVAPRKSK